MMVKMKFGIVFLLLLEVVQSKPVKNSGNVTKVILKLPATLDTIIERLQAFPESQSRAEAVMIDYIKRRLEEETEDRKIVDVFEDLKPAVDTDGNGQMSKEELKLFVDKVKKRCAKDSPEMNIYPALAEVIRDLGPDAYLFKILELLFDVDKNKDNRYTAQEIDKAKDNIAKEKKHSQDIKQHFYYIFWILFGTGNYNATKSDQSCTDIFDEPVRMVTEAKRKLPATLDTIIERLETFPESKSQTEAVMIDYIKRRLDEQTEDRKIVDVFENLKPAVDTDGDGQMSQEELKLFVDKVKKRCAKDSPEMNVYPALAEVLRDKGPDAYLFKIFELLFDVDKNKDNLYTAQEIDKAKETIAKGKTHSLDIKQHFYYIFWILFGRGNNNSTKSDKSCTDIFDESIRTVTDVKLKLPATLDTIIERLEALPESKSQTEAVMIDYIRRRLEEETEDRKIVDVFENLKPAVDTDGNGQMSKEELKLFVDKVKKRCAKDSPEMNIYPALAEVLRDKGPDAYLFKIFELLFDVDKNKDNLYTAQEIDKAKDIIAKGKTHSLDIKQHFYYMFWILFGTGNNNATKSDKSCTDIFDEPVRQVTDVKVKLPATLDTIIERLEALPESKSQTEAVMIDYIRRRLEEQTEDKKIVDVFENLKPSVDTDGDGEMSKEELNRFAKKIKNSCAKNSPEMNIYPALAEVIRDRGPDASMFDIFELLFDVDKNNDNRYTAQEINKAKDNIAKDKKNSQDIKQHFYYIFWMLFGTGDNNDNVRKESDKICTDIFDEPVRKVTAVTVKLPATLDTVIERLETFSESTSQTEAVMIDYIRRRLEEQTADKKIVDVFENLKPTVDTDGDGEMSKEELKLFAAKVKYRCAISSPEMKIYPALAEVIRKRGPDAYMFDIFEFLFDIDRNRDNLYTAKEIDKAKDKIAKGTKQSLDFKQHFNYIFWILFGTGDLNAAVTKESDKSCTDIFDEPVRPDSTDLYYPTGRPIKRPHEKYPDYTYRPQQRPHEKYPDYTYYRPQQRPYEKYPNYIYRPQQRPYDRYPDNTYYRPQQRPHQGYPDYKDYRQEYKYKCRPNEPEYEDYAFDENYEYTPYR